MRISMIESQWPVCVLCSDNLQSFKQQPLCEVLFSGSPNKWKWLDRFCDISPL